MASEEGQVINCDTVDRWNELLQKGNESKKLVVVHFTTGRWGSYHQVGSLLDPIAKKKPDVIYVKIIIDTLKSVAEEWAMEALPTVVFIKEGKVVDRIVGGEQYEVWSAVVKHSSPATQDFWWGGPYKVWLAVVKHSSPATVTPTA